MSVASLKQLFIIVDQRVWLVSLCSGRGADELSDVPERRVDWVNQQILHQTDPLRKTSLWRDDVVKDDRDVLGGQNFLTDGRMFVFTLQDTLHVLFYTERLGVQQLNKGAITTNRILSSVFSALHVSVTTAFFMKPGKTTARWKTMNFKGTVHPKLRIHSSSPPSMLM